MTTLTMDERKHAAARPERKVLVVDDEDKVRRLITLVLAHNGYRPVEARNGRVALDRLRQGTFDLVITDLQMPEMDGLALLEACRALYPATDIIVLTAYGTVQSAVYALKRGADDFLTKPFEINELAQRVDSCFERRQARLEAAKRSPIEPLVELGRLLASQADPLKMLDSIVDLIQRTFGAASIEGVLFDTPTDVTVVQNGDLPEKSGYSRPGREFMRQLAEQDDAWLLRDPGSLADANPHAQSGWGVTVPLLSGEGVVGALTVVRAAPAARFNQADARLLQLFGLQLGISVLHSRTRQRLLSVFSDLKEATLSTVQTLFAAIETYDQYTHAHSERVSRCAYLLGQRIGMPEEQLETLRIAGLFHDVGKLGVGDSALHKNGSLTSDEFDRMRQHPVMGARILAGMEAFKDVIPMIRHHHEHYAGSGYPDCLMGEAIPMGARILAVVDAYDSMTSDRPYRPALSVNVALTRLMENARGQFDPQLVQAWCAWVQGNTHIRNPLSTMGDTRAR